MLYLLQKPPNQACFVNDAASVFVVSSDLIDRFVAGMTTVFSILSIRVTDLPSWSIARREYCFDLCGMERLAVI